MAYGIGMIVGPTMGGWITSYYNDQFAAGKARLLHGATPYGVSMHHNCE